MAKQRVVVTVRGGEQVRGPLVEADEAKAQLEKIKDVLGSAQSPDIDWIAVLGSDVLSARLALPPARPRSG
jgi:hypothetical protein